MKQKENVFLITCDYTTLANKFWIKHKESKWNPASKIALLQNMTMQVSEHYITENLSIHGGKGNQLSLAAHPEPIGLMQIWIYFIAELCCFSVWGKTQ